MTPQDWYRQFTNVVGISFLLMTLRLRAFAVISFLAWWVFIPAQALTFRETQVELLMHGGIPHADRLMPVFTNDVPYGGPLTVQSDVSWVTPSWDAQAKSIVLKFSTAQPLQTETATIRAVIPGKTNAFYVQAALAPLQIVRMIADPLRPRVYALHQSGVGKGSLIVLDSRNGKPLMSQTLGARPTDLVVHPDTGELWVLHTVDRMVMVLGLPGLQTRKTLALPEFTNWGADATEGNLALGNGDIVYYSDGSWAPVLYVWNTATGQILQRLNIDSNGFGGFALSPDRKTLIGWAQYGWSAGWGGSYIARYDVAADSTLIFRESTNSQWPTPIVRDPLDAPVLFNGSGSRVFVKQLMVDAGAVSSTLQSFSSCLYAISPGGEIAATTTGVFQTSTGNQLITFPPGAQQPVLTPDYARLIYFNSTARTFESVDLIAQVGTKILGLELFPSDGAVTALPSRLRWIPVTGATQYRVYLGSDRETVRTAETEAKEFLGEVPLSEWSQGVPVETGKTYYWRADALVEGALVRGDVYSFTVSPLTLSDSSLQTSTLAGLKAEVVSLEVTSPKSEVPWFVSSPDSWISFVTNQGVTPARIQVIVDASQIGVGTQSGSIRIGTSSDTFCSIPLQVRVDPLFLTVIQNDPGSVFAYAISENTQSSASKAHLLEINTETQQITRRVEVGSSVTDLAIHQPEGRIYVANWRSGALLAVNRATFQVERTYAFTPFAGAGGGGGDVFRISAGVAGRLVVEEADQWIKISLFDTRSGTLLQSAPVREGGGRYDPSGRYYYHGENNSSGATIQRYDTSGDGFVPLASVRVESAGYYGSRVVTISEDGNRIFWNGSVFDPSLKEIWTLGEHIYSCTEDGRYAFGQEHIFDTLRRTQVLQMPQATTVSSYNKVTRKLVVQQGGSLKFYALGENEITLPAPELTATSLQPDRVQLQWVDRSLEMAFVLQMRRGGAETWTDLVEQAANTTAYEVTGLDPEATYQFRVRATAKSVSSPWSDILTVSTPGYPPTLPALVDPIASFRGVQLTWGDVFRETGFLLERRTNGAPWVAIQLAADTRSYYDTNVISGVAYQYRLSATNVWSVSSTQDTQMVLVPFPAPPASPVVYKLRMMTGLHVRVEWTPVLEVQGYEIERLSPGSTQWEVVGAVKADVLHWDDTVLEVGKSYSYRLVAVNEYGRSQASSPALITTEWITNLVADDFESGLSPIAWDSVTGAQVRSGAADFGEGQVLWFGLGGPRVATTVPVPIRMGSVIEFSIRVGSRGATNAIWDPAEQGEGVMLEFSSNGMNWVSLRLLELSSLIPAGTWIHQSMPIPPQFYGDASRLRWRQINHSGVSEDTWALDDVSLQGPVASSPSAPDWVMATSSSSTTIDLAWEREAMATAYRVQRYSGSQGWVDIALVPGRQNSFSDSDRIPGSTYRYRVASLLGSVESAPSHAVYGQAISQFVEWSVENTGVAPDPFAAIPDALWLRYAFNLGTGLPWTVFQPPLARSGLPRIEVDAKTHRVSFDFLRRKSSKNPHIQYQTEMSTDCITWKACGRLVSIQSLDSLWEWVRYEEDNASGSAGFFRVAIQPEP